MAILPKPKTIQATLSSNLNRVQAEIAEDMDKIKQVQVLTSSFIKEHFERIRPGQVIPESAQPLIHVYFEYLF